MKKVRLLVALATMFAMVFAAACGDDGGESNCSDGYDNDMDGLYDCQDPDCYNSAACAGTETICDDSLDNDMDGLFDCNDPDCAASAACSGVCGNNLCETGETVTCPQDCQTVCNNNGTCDTAAGETAANCPADCGSVCDNNGTCDTAAGETTANCPNDCPGTQACDAPEDLWNQTGCSAGEACTLIDAQNNIGCATAGSVAAYGVCTPENDCAPGAGCLGSGTDFSCMPWCDLNGGGPACPQSGLCLYSFTTAQGTVGLCALPDNCDLVYGTGCGTGEGCYLADQSGSTVCITEGTVALGGSCQYTNDCAAGVGCIGNPGVCTELCKNDGDCTSGTCQGIGQVAPGTNNADVGACQP